MVDANAEIFKLSGDLKLSVPAVQVPVHAEVAPGGHGGFLYSEGHRAGRDEALLRFLVLWLNLGP